MRQIFTILLLLVCVSSCGQKGDLFIEDSESETTLQKNPETAVENEQDTNQKSGDG